MKAQGNKGKPNGHRRSNSRQGTPPSSTRTMSSEDDKLLFLAAKSIGKPCVITVATGARYSGSLLAVDLAQNAPASIVINKPTLLSGALITEKTNIDAKLPDRLVVEGKNLIDFEVTTSLSGTEEPVPKQSSPLKSDSVATPPAAETKQEVKPSTESTSTFKTDTDISATTTKAPVRERELQRWVPDDDSKMVSLEDSGKGHWDQFKVNEEKFGVGSTYDESLYTTKINTSGADYKKRLKEATIIAREIESQSSTDRHILEERGIQVDDSGVDEEDKYSGVDRRGDELMAALKNATITDEPPILKSDGKYVTPRHRAAHYHNDPAIVSSSAAGESKGDSNAQVSKEYNESFRLNAQSEINSLREFSANFKIPHRMPTDLLPILAKDKSKQSEILKKQDKPKEVKDTSGSQSPQPTLLSKRMDPTKPAFKLNPKAAAFTPSKSSQMSSPVPSKAGFRSPVNPSPRLNNQRTYTSGSSSGSGNSKRHYQISPAEFFGGSDKVPTKDTQKKKVEQFKISFNLFITAQKTQNTKTPTIEKTFITPPTWTFTDDLPHTSLFPTNANRKTMMSPTPMPFSPSPLMGAPMVPANYAGMPPPNGKFPMSPQHQQAAAMAAMQQQQQMHAAMMLQHQQHLQMSPGQAPVPMFPQADMGQYFPPGYVPSPTGFGNVSPNGNVMNQYGSPMPYNRRFGPKRT
ncbi:hypothetical protein PGUG_03010 [Meyerozyma guilliermondii ATCC 6260]|uniref:LsmAD domain-containing protein n=1 Tax=Meyerozyma guilliermondii (strain ATCC 6260 / CBS 566 / DSM 6381 / JCM 1539 / NBRC 10279 / NRRL Y-324) TaxID=294746 RepID=A5DIA9_PICGU|nr:uncharacterized protein PGUG_03010 [Meyerozyma guilliermondii ATCC 6260]EDK38912.2 hypothetical protein PGUG_03010 [Meyerozyma guilliermondii ATCC 6260]